jgi:hypothetical protein
MEKCWQHYIIELSWLSATSWVDPSGFSPGLCNCSTRCESYPCADRDSARVLVQLHKGMVEMTLGGKEITDDETQTSLEFS